MNHVKAFLLELAYHEKATARFHIEGVKLYLYVSGLSQMSAQKLVKKYFPLSLLYSVKEKEVGFAIF